MNKIFQNKLYELVNRLFVGTSQGDIKWSETADEDSFRAILNTGLVRVERTPARQNGTEAKTGPNMVFQEPGSPFPVGNFEYVLLVLDDKNKEIARYFPDRLERGMTLRNLWELACNSARNAEQKIDGLLEEVESRVKKRSPSFP